MAKLPSRGAQLTFRKSKLYPVATACFGFVVAILGGCVSDDGSDGGSGGSGGETYNLSFTPASGPIGTLLTVTGTSVDLSSASAATVGGTQATIVNTSASSLQIVVMPGTSTGSVGVTTSSGANASTSSFTVTSTQVVSQQQGSKLVGTGNTGTSRQGTAAALSCDGNTALVAGSTDNSNTGAAWIFVRSSGTWSQEGTKLVGTGGVGSGRQGASAALSCDGNTAIIGGYADNSNQGAAWVFTRSAGTWSQQGSKLVGTGAVGPAQQGLSVALSCDGNTALIGGLTDDSNNGAAWVFTRSAGTTWTQQGTKLVGTGAVGAAKQGVGVALSCDGNTALLGGSDDNSGAGAAWVFTRSGSTWSQEGTKLVGSGASGGAEQGYTVALSADGNTAMLGGISDNSSTGAAWVFVRSSGAWSQQGSKLVGTGRSGAYRQGTSGTQCRRKHRPHRGTWRQL